MRNYLYLATLILVQPFLLHSKELNPPTATRKPVVLEAHGVKRQDPYFWMRDRDAPEVLSYLESENEYTRLSLAHTEPLQVEIFDEIVGRIQKDDRSVPHLFNHYYYNEKFVDGGEYPIYTRKAAKFSWLKREQVLLDVNKLAEGFSYYHVKNLSVSPDNRYLVFGVDEVSRRQYDLRFKDLVKNELLSDRIPNTTGEAVWANDNKTVFYVVKDSTLRAHKIMRHIVGTDHTADVEVYHEADNTFSIEIVKSKSGQFIFIASMSTVSDEYLFLNADDPLGKFKVLEPRRRDFKYSVWHHGQHFYILSNDQGINFRLAKAPTGSPALANWENVIPHDSKTYLQKLDVFKNYLVISQRQNGSQQLRVLPMNGSDEFMIPFYESVYTISTSNNFELDTPILRYEYSSFTTPKSIYDFNLDSKKLELKKQDQVLGGYDQNDYIASKTFATADDGTEIPISLVHRQDTKLNGETPLLLYAYGSYGYSSNASFNYSRISLLDRGWIFAIAHVRGGTELGYSWYNDGKLLKKINTFTDFINCGEYLIEHGYTDSDHIFGIGGSAGGLLVGAVANMRPDLFQGLVAEVPWVDVVTTMLDDTIPLTTGEYDEWGNPNIKEYHDYMLSYSPYDNVAEVEYPAMLVTTGYYDSQVQYWEPAKWVARLRERKTDQNTLLFNCNMDAGHGGASGRFEMYKEYAMVTPLLLMRPLKKNRTCHI